MNIALIIFCIIIYLAFNQKNSKSSIKKYIFIITTILVLVSSLRHEAVGNDTYAYMLKFDSCSLMSWSEITSNFWDLYLNPGDEGKDPGELVIIKAFTYIIPNARWFLFVAAALLLIPLGIFVYRNSETLETPCFFYVFYITMFYAYLPNSALRQSFALSLLLLAYLLWQKGKTKSFIFLLLLATLIHKSIIIVALLLPFYYFKKTKFLYRSGFVLFVFMLFAYQEVGVFLASQSDIYQMYASGAYLQSAPYMVILMLLGLYIVGLLGVGRDQNPYNQRLMYGGALMTLVWCVLVRLDPSLIRIIAYFGPWMGLMVPYCLRKWRPYDYKLFLFFIIFIFMFRAIITPDDYHFMWQEMQLHERY